MNLEKLLKRKEALEAKIKELNLIASQKEEFDGDDYDAYNDLMEELSYVKYDIKRLTCDYVSSSGECYFYGLNSF